MKSTTTRRIAALSSLFLAASCVEPPRPAPQVAAPVPIAPIKPTPLAALAADWMDRPAAAGDWGYRMVAGGSIAAFGMADAGAQFLVRCDRAARRIVLLHPGVLPPGKGATMTVKATETEARYPVTNATDGSPYVAASLAPGDAALDELAFSRGRFLVQVEGAADLVLPTWPEMARVVEDCRG